jgi:hypothetical protein
MSGHGMRTKTATQPTRVTRRDGEKVAQNVAQPIFLSKVIPKFGRWKKYSKIRATSVIFKKKSKVNNHTTGQKFAHSGHPAANTFHTNL